MTTNQQNSFHVIEEIVRCNQLISTVELFTPSLAPLVQERAVLSTSDVSVISQGDAWKSQIPLPFWDRVMAAAVLSNELPVGILKAAVYHNKATEGLREIPRENVTIAELNRLDALRSPLQIFAVSSKVKCTDGITRHIPQIDFHCHASEHNLKLIVSVMCVLEMSGYVLCSGKSYHFIGSSLLTQEEFPKFMGRILFFSPIVDRSWISHQLIEGKSALRISSRPGYGGPPVCVARV